MVAALNIAESRETRFRRSALLKSGIHLQKPFDIKIADELSDWIGSFRLLYEEYLRAGYIVEENSSRILFNIHHILPGTAVSVAKVFKTPVSTLTLFLDNRMFGLPSDRIYQEELNKLRDRGRVIAELGSLVSKKQVRWQDQLLYLCRVMYWYSRMRNVDDLCISVNPKHVSYYKTVFLFEVLGKERIHPGVQAPAVLMRLNLNKYQKNLMSVYGQMDRNLNLNDFIHSPEGCHVNDFSVPLKEMGAIAGDTIPLMNVDVVRKLLNANAGILKGLSAPQITYIKHIYPEYFFLYQS